MFITLHPSVDISRFPYQNESYVVKEGVRTTIIRQEGKKDKVIRITGLHPNTKDQAVIKYLSAHGTVSTTEKVIHHVFPGEPGSSLCAGKLNGNRSYMVELKVAMGSYHIIDGEKVSIRYGGQEWTCARCQQCKRDCPGKAVAKECTAVRVMLSTYMMEHWGKIGYIPDTETMNEVDQEEPEVQVGGITKQQIIIPESSFTSKYNSVIVKGFRPETSLEDISDIIKQEGSFTVLNSEDILKNEKSGNLTIENLKPEKCLLLSEKMNRKRFLNRQIFVTSVVANSPTKPPPAQHQPEPHSAAPGKQSSTKNNLAVPKSNTPPPKVPDLGKPLVAKPNEKSAPSSDSVQVDNLLDNFVFGQTSPGVQQQINILEKQNSCSKLLVTPLPSKRKSENSPELSNKEKKLIRSTEKKKQKQEARTSRTLNVH